MAAINAKINRIENNPDKIDLINKTRDLQRRNAELEHHRDKLLKFNSHVRKGLESSLAPQDALSEEMAETAVAVGEQKAKHAQLTEKLRLFHNESKRELELRVE